MCTDVKDLTPYQRLALVWNELMHVRQDLPPDQFFQVTTALGVLDVVIRAVQQDNPSAPLPLFPDPCNCKPSHRAGL